jgi:predicted oxidoreductase
MKKVYLSDSGPKVSPAIYGFWRWSEEGDNSIKEAEKIINLCLELEINTFDLADVYGRYQSEEIFGKIMQLKSFKREDIVLFTKCGLNKVDANRPEYRVKHYDTSREHILKSVDNSLKKLNTDYIDLFLLHHSDPLMELEETASALMEIVANGKVKHIGIANFTVHQHQMLASYLPTPIVTHNIELSLLHTSAIDDGRLDFMKQKFCKPLAFSPLAGGRINNGTDDKAVKVRKKLEAIGQKYNANIEQTAVAWLIKLGALPIIGTLNEARIRNAASAFSFELDRQDWFELYAAASDSGKI